MSRVGGIFACSALPTLPDWRALSPLFSLLEKIRELANRFFSWLFGAHPYRVSDEEVWEETKRIVQRQQPAQPHPSAPSPLSFAPQSPLAASDSGSIPSMEPHTPRASVVRGPSPLFTKSQLSVSALADQEGLDAHMAELKLLMLRSAAALADQITEAYFYWSELSLQDNVVRWIDELMHRGAPSLPDFTAVRTLGSILSDWIKDLDLPELQALVLTHLKDKKLPQVVKGIEARIRKECSEELLNEIFPLTEAGVTPEKWHARKKATRAFFAMLGTGVESEQTQAFWDDRLVAKPVRHRLLLDVSLLLIAGPIARYLEGEGEKLQESFPNFLKRCARENALKIAEHLFTRFQALLAGGEPRYQALFDRLFAHVSGHIAFVEGIEAKKLLHIEEMKRWVEEKIDFARFQQPTLQDNIQAYLLQEIVQAVCALRLRWLNAEECYRLEQGVLAWKTAPGFALLTEKQRQEVERVLGELNKKGAAPKQEKKGWIPPRWMTQVQLLAALNDRHFTEAGEAIPQDLEPFCASLKKRMIRTKYMQERLEPRWELAHLVEELIALFFPAEPQERAPEPSSELSSLMKFIKEFLPFEAVASIPHGMQRDGIVALVKGGWIPPEWKEVFVDGVKVLPGKILEGFWSEQKQKLLEEALASSSVLKVLDWLVERKILEVLRPKIAEGIKKGVQKGMDLLTEPQELDDLLASGLLASANKTLLFQLALMTLRKGIEKDGLGFKEEKSVEELVMVVPTWIEAHLKPVFDSCPLPLQQLFKQSLPALLRLDLLREALQKKVGEEKKITKSTYITMLGSHFADSSTAAAEAAPKEYGALLRSLIVLCRYSTADEGITKRIEGVLDTSMSAVMEEYRKSPDALLRHAATWLSSFLTQEEVSALFKSVTFLERRTQLDRLQGSLDGENRAHQRWQRPFNERRADLEQVALACRRKEEEHAVDSVQKRLRGDIQALSHILHPMLSDLSGRGVAAEVSSYPLGRFYGSFVGAAAEAFTSGWFLDPKEMEAALLRAIRTALGDRRLNRFLLNRLLGELFALVPL